MCHNSGTWYDSSQVKFTMNKIQSNVQIRKSKPTWEQSRQSYLAKVVPVSLGNNCASHIWEQSCQSHLETNVPTSLRNNYFILTSVQPCQPHLRTTLPVSSWNNRTGVSWEQLCQGHAGTIVLLLLSNSCASLT